MLRLKRNVTKTYQTNTNGNTERLNRTNISDLLRYVLENAKNWDLFTDTLTLAHKTQFRTWSSILSFEMVLSRAQHEL